MKNKVFVLAAIAVAASGAIAAPTFQQGFETDTSGWLDGSDFAGYGTITRVASGTGGIASSSGSHHAVVAGTGSSGVSAPFTRYGGYSSVWPGDFVASLDVYLDTSWALGTGFDFTSAISNQSGAHLRDFIFHVTKDTSTQKLLVGGSNNTNNAVREDLETLNNYEVANSGWYTLQHVFRDAAGALAVDLNLLDDMGNVLFTETRTNNADLIATVVGGNRYGWFTFVNVSGGVEIDNTSLGLRDDGTVPTPGTLALAGLALLGLAANRRRS
jgi:hypothetical protein